MGELPNHLRLPKARSSRSQHHGEKEKYSKKSEKTQNSTDDKKDKIMKEKKRNKHGKGYPKNSAGYPKKKTSNSDGYGYKKSTRSATSAHSTNEDQQLFEEEIELKKLREKKTWKKTGSSFGMALFMFCSLVLLSNYMDYSSEEVQSDYDYKHAYSSVTHHKFSLMSDSLLCSRMIVKLSNIVVDPEKVRMASLLHTVCFSVMARLLGYTSRQQMVDEASQMSVLSWGAVADKNTMNPGPIFVHNAPVTRMQLAQVLQFGSSENTMSTGFFENSLSTDCSELNLRIDYMTARNLSAKTPREKLAFLNLFIPDIKAITFGCKMKLTVSSTNILPLSVSSLPMHSNGEKFGTLQFVSSGPNTLGVIAEAAVYGTLLQVLTTASAVQDLTNTNLNFNNVELVDNIIAQTLIYAMDEFADYYIKHNAFPKKAEDLIPDLLEGKTITNKKDKSEVKFIGNATTVNMLFMDNRSGWPSVYHFSTTSPGKFYLQFRGTNTTEMVNTCQLVVIKDGRLWMTAAASGTKYLLEKVVASVVHRILFRADPLSTLDRKRTHYDTWHQEIRTDNQDDSSSPVETLQFSEYNVVEDSFRSWLQPKAKWNLPTGI